MWSLKKSAPNERHISAGQYLFREGDMSSCIFILKKGTISVRKRKGDGEIEIARVYTNEVLGEISFFDRQPRSAAAIALTEVEALEIPFESLEKIFEKVPPYFRTIMASIAERLRKADDVIRKLDGEVIHGTGVKPASEDAFSATDALAALDPDSVSKALSEMDSDDTDPANASDSGSGSTPKSE